jgi:hypothetical protein
MFGRHQAGIGHQLFGIVETGKMPTSGTSVAALTS